MISLRSRPRLSARAKLRFDKKTNQTMLLYPERGMILNATGAAILELCTGDLTVAMIADRLARSYEGGRIRERENEVLAFLQALDRRGLLTAVDAS